MFTDEVQTALTRMQNIDEDVTAAELNEENNAVDALAAAFGDALENDDVKTERYKQLASAASDSLNHYTKTNVKDRLEDVVAERTGEDYPELTEYVEEHAAKIVIRRSTDNKQDVEYIVHFRSGAVMECRADPGDGLAVNSPQWWTSQVRVATGQTVDDPDLENLDFQEWVDQLLDGDRGVTVDENDDYRGPRTERVDALRARIRAGRAFSTVADAIADGGMYLDDDADELYVPSDRITSLLDDTPVNENEFLRELVARELGAERLDGAFTTSLKAEIEGETQWEDYWVFDVDIAEPGVVDPDGTDPVAAVQEAVTGRSDAVDGDEGDAEDASGDDAECIDRPAPGGDDADEENVVTGDDVADADDSDDEFDAEAEQANVADAVKNVIRQADADRVEQSAVIEAVTSEHDPVDAETVEREIERLQQRGEMYDPTGGELSLT